MKTNKKPGALPKFGNVETKLLRITRVVPLSYHDEIKDKANDYIKELEKEILKNK